MSVVAAHSLSDASIFDEAVEHSPRHARPQPRRTSISSHHGPEHEPLLLSLPANGIVEDAMEAQEALLTAGSADNAQPQTAWGEVMRLLGLAGPLILQVQCCC